VSFAQADEAGSGFANKQVVLDCAAFARGGRSRQQTASHKTGRDHDGPLPIINHPLPSLAFHMVT
jgi:hypothetical protein